MASTTMSGQALDRVLGQLADAEDAANNDLILYIRGDGNIAFATEEALFSVTRLEAET